MYIYIFITSPALVLIRQITEISMDRRSRRNNYTYWRIPDYCHKFMVAVSVRIIFQWFGSWNPRHPTRLCATCWHKLQQESPAVADKPARRKSMPKFAPIRCAYNVVADNTGLLFNRILNQPDHVLHFLLPPPSASQYNLRDRPHNRLLCQRASRLTDCNFIIRMLYSDMYSIDWLCVHFTALCLFRMWKCILTFL